MAFTGDLEHLHIVDIIQLLHTTRKSGTFSVKGPRGESRIIFSNGYIVGASHLDGKIRIGTVLVKMNAITAADLEEAFSVQKNAGKNRKPLIMTLIDLGKLSLEEASYGLRKLIEITIVEVLNWKSGTFTLDMEAISVSPECSYLPDRMDQEVSLDGQMILMDALRVFDERERDRQSGKDVPSYEEMFADVIPPQKTVVPERKGSVITADDLGLADLDHLERKIPQFSPVSEQFNPVEMHRQKIKETLTDFSAEEQETIVAFLGKSSAGANPFDRPSVPEGRSRALILFSDDEFLKHSVMTICKNEGILSFATDGEEELEKIVAQCLVIKALPFVIFDTPEIPEGIVSKEKIIALRRHIKEKYPPVAVLQMSSVSDYADTLHAYQDGVRAVFTKPSTTIRRTTFIEDAILFLQTFSSYIKSFFDEQPHDGMGDRMVRLRERISAFRQIQNPPDISFALLQAVAEIFERAITFVVRPHELVGEKALGVYAEKDKGSSSASWLKIPLSGMSVFHDVIETGDIFFGESNDALLREHLHATIGAPLNPAILLLPMKSRGKIISLTYADFGRNKISAIDPDALAILAELAGLIVENALYRKLISKTMQK
jgi:hypothetical protein